MATASSPCFAVELVGSGSSGIRAELCGARIGGTVVGMVARYSLELRFLNRHTAPIEARYSH